MKSTTLPIHPITGLTALGISKRGPIWPVLGGSGAGDGAGGDGGNGDGDGSGDGEDLGDAGKKALDAERAARKAAEKSAKDLAAKVKAFEDSQKSDADKNAERYAELEKQAAKALRYEAAAKAELPMNLAARLQGENLDELVADAKTLKDLIGSSGKQDQQRKNHVPKEGTQGKPPNSSDERAFVRELFGGQ